MQYQKELDLLILQINPCDEAWKCKDYNCTKHVEYIKNIHSKIVKICKEASEKTLPHTSQNKDIKIIPGWNEHVKEHADRANIWHRTWINIGRPPHGYVANMRRKTRLKYHYTLRRVVKDNIRIRNEKMGEAISENNDRILWDEVKKMTKTNNRLPNMMDGATEPADITNIFTGKYRNLYNSVGYDTNEFKRLSAEIDSHIKDGCKDNLIAKYHSHTITLKNVEDAIDSLKMVKKKKMACTQITLSMVPKD